MIQRTEYIEKLKEWRDEQIIKVVTGIRRCGKSTLLEQYQEYLLSVGVLPEQILSVNFESLEFEELPDYHKLYDYLKERLCPDKYTYIFLDEIQKVADFEKVVDSLYILKNVDIYITGSNAWLLSGELATLLSGRYVEISILPLSFAEYCEAQGEVRDYDKAFAGYIETGGFPYLACMDSSKEKVDMYLEGIYNTIIIKDIEERQKRRESEPEKRRVTDIALLRSIAKFLAGSVGSLISVKSVSDYITSTGRRISANTVADYMGALTESFIFYTADRYDVTGKQLLKQNPKYYIVDTGLRRYLLPRKNYDLGFALENVIYLELCRRGYKVNVGKAGNTEVDFVAEKNNRTTYFQVTASMTDEAVFEREIRSLRRIRDNYPKAVLTLERFTVGDYDGIEVINAVDWLLGR